jgi:hypothetical protein
MLQLYSLVVAASTIFMILSAFCRLKALVSIPYIDESIAWTLFGKSDPLDSTSLCLIPIPNVSRNVPCLLRTSISQPCTILHFVRRKELLVLLDLVRV